MKISISELETYMRCPRAFRLHVLEEVMPQHKKVSQCQAISAKKVIALYSENKNVIELTPSKVEELCESVWKEEIADPRVDVAELNAVVTQGKPATKNRQEIPAVTKGEKALEEVKSWCVGYAQLEQSSEVVASNVYFEDTIADVVFHGCIDQIRRDPKEGLQIVIFRTCSQPLHLQYLARDFALSLFSHAVWQGHLSPDFRTHGVGSEIPSVYVYYLPYLEQYKKNGKQGKKGELRGNPLIPVSRDKKFLLDFEYEILQVVAGIQVNYFPMRVSNPCGCSICPYAYQCASAGSMQTVLECVQDLDKSVEYATSLEV